MKTLITVIHFAMLALMATACGSSNTTDPNAALYNQSVYGSSGTQTLTPGGAISFTVSGAQVSQTGIYAGYLPTNSTYPGTHGSVIMGTSTLVNTGYSYGSSLSVSKTSSTGLLQLQIMNGAVTGEIQLTPQVSYALMAYMPQGYTNYGNSPYTSAYSGGYPSTGLLTVSAVGIDAVYTNTNGYTGYINQALVYLTMSTGQTVGPIPFY
jgi:hypothetical protein